MSVVAIVGRPNVGKSTLFNRLIGERKALVSDFPGLTRDRHYAMANWCGRDFTLIDTGGLSFEKAGTITAEVHRQSLIALEEADLVICLFDGREGITSVDRDVVDLFRRCPKSVIYAVNKMDTSRAEELAIEFSELGVDFLPVSAETGRDVDVLLDKVVSMLPAEAIAVVEGGGRGVRIALVGRPNVGKSTIINCLAKEERMVVNEVPGTTRDAIDVNIPYKGMDYVFVDTAGVKKRPKTRGKIDKFATIKSLKAIEIADIVFVVADAEEGFTRQDMNLVAHAFNSYKAVAVLVNKWDRVTSREGDYIRGVRTGLKELHRIPVLCISGKTGFNCEKIFDTAAMLDEAMQKRVTTSQLNSFIKALLEENPPLDWRGTPVKVNYITQVGVKPPFFVLFTNCPEGIRRPYRSFLVKGLRRLLGGETIPVAIKLRSKSKR